MIGLASVILLEMKVKKGQVIHIIDRGRDWLPERPLTENISNSPYGIP